MLPGKTTTCTTYQLAMCLLTVTLPTLSPHSLRSEPLRGGPGQYYPSLTVAFFAHLLGSDFLCKTLTLNTISFFPENTFQMNSYCNVPFQELQGNSIWSLQS